jgi:predicted transcriptional regulator
MNTPQNLKTAVLIHTYDSRLADWAEVVWGDPLRGRLGRAPKGLSEAWLWDADKIILSGPIENGNIAESRRILEYALAHQEELAELLGVGAPQVSAWLDARVVIDERAQNTQEEIAVAAQIAKELRIGRLILVSSPTHIMRCHQTALSFLGANPEYSYLLSNLYTIASDTCYTGSTVDDVTIIDPPHRTDIPHIRFNETIKGIFPFFQRPELAADLNDSLREVINQWKQKL